MTLDADPVRLAQVIANLLNNAAKYTDEGGRITLVGAARGRQAVVRVRDSGIGIRRRHAAARVRPVRAGRPHLDRAQGGLGIGLTLVRTLVELHGGTVAAQSEGLGRGSEFIVRLPLGVERADGAERAQQPASATASSRRTVFSSSTTTATRPRAWRCCSRVSAPTCTSASDGPTRSSALEAYRPSVVLLDIGMPGMDGSRSRGARGSYPSSRDLTLIALTGWGQDEDRRRSREAGIDYHLVKPVDFDELGHLLTALAPPGADRARMS